MDHLQLAIHCGLASAGCSPALKPPAAVEFCGHQAPHKEHASCKNVHTWEGMTPMLLAEQLQSGRQHGLAKQGVLLRRHARLVGGQGSLTFGCASESCVQRQAMWL